MSGKKQAGGKWHKKILSTVGEWFGNGGDSKHDAAKRTHTKPGPNPASHPEHEGPTQAEIEAAKQEIINFITSNSKDISKILIVTDGTREAFAIKFSDKKEASAFKNNLKLAKQQIKTETLIMPDKSAIVRIKAANNGAKQFAEIIGNQLVDELKKNNPPTQWQTYQIIARAPNPISSIEDVKKLSLHRHTIAQETKIIITGSLQKLGEAQRYLDSVGIVANFYNDKNINEAGDRLEVGKSVQRYHLVIEPKLCTNTQILEEFKINELSVYDKKASLISIDLNLPHPKLIELIEEINNAQNLEELESGQKTIKFQLAMNNLLN